MRIEAAALRGLEAGQRELLGRPLTEAERREILAGYVDDQVLLHEALRSSNVSASEMVVDVVNSEPDKRSVAGIVSCSKKYLSGLVEVLPKLFRQEVEKAARNRVMPTYRESFRVEVAKLGDDATAIGAGAWAEHTSEVSPRTEQA